MKKSNRMKERRQFCSILFSNTNIDRLLIYIYPFCDDAKVTKTKEYKKNNQNPEKYSSFV